MASLKFPTKFWYGFGQVAEGIKQGAFDPFLFFYYTQVLGLSGTMTGTAMLVALMVDAITDPLAGSISDNHRSRWGRRHPFIYGAAIPLGCLFVLLFRPPDGLEGMALFAWLTSLAVLVRTAMTVYLVPHLALGAELTNDYQERTTVVAYRIMFTQIANAAVLPLSLWLFFSATAEYADGQLDPGAYAPFAWFFGSLMIVTVLVSGVGTHSRIPFLSQPPDKREALSVRRIVSEMGEALKSPSFRWFFASILVYALSRGLQGSLNLHMFTYFWELDPEQIRAWGMAAFVGSVSGVAFWALAAHRLGKRNVFVAGFALWGICFGWPPVLHLLGWFPAPESAAYFPAIATLGGLGMFCAASYVTGGSMMADLTDEHELATGKRREGIFFGAISFSSKTTSGVGHWIAGIGLDWIRFPSRAQRGEVPVEIVGDLGLLYGPALFVLALVGAGMVARYRLTRGHVEEIQRALRERATGAGS